MTMAKLLNLYTLCFLLQIHTVYSMLDPLDFLALQSIKNSLHDMPGSNYFASWDFTGDPCNFAGVYCDGGKVISLNLGDPRAGSPGLTGHLHPAIGKLTSLAEFTVVPGRIVGILPPSFSELKNLRFLGISRNFISGDIPAGLGELRLLRTLDLSYNQLTGIIPWSVGNLPALTNVILGHNSLSGSVPRFGSQVLTRLDLKHNELSGSIGSDFLPPSLHYLSLSKNRLSGPVDQVLSKMIGLNYLDLSQNEFTGNIPGCLFTFPILNLYLQRNLFTGSVQPYDQVRIPTVDLSYNRLSGQISPLFATVQTLYLNNNRFMGQVPSTFVHGLLDASMQNLYLQHNYLTGIDINPTVEIPVRSSLCLQYNCMVLPVQTPCPLKAGKQKTRPTVQCIVWNGGVN
ncbi:leucine-rich repeat receptor-like protein kinase IMK2 [Heracleum sosnowskyi]|uniref:Leucine-rich repeat receptor-like protein kinase IMK2 n=1 Tax=Heracleum sosnowskyi TaxID=360622 RepID=A0AAD8JAR2_9APIA|nr:leucine-rich repeat receptor-like protein kinase IMK2 [Heracleum sosnowskyi]